MKMPGSGSLRVIIPVSVLCLFFLAVTWGSYFRQNTFEKKDALAAAIRNNSNLALALEQYAVRTLHNADALLQIVKLEYALQGDSLDLNRLLENSHYRDLIETVAISGPDGAIKLAGFTRPDSSHGLSNRPWIRFHQQHPTDSLLISKPFLCPATGSPVIVLSRPLRDAEGRFAGAVTLEIDPATFTSFYAKAQLRPNDIISLVAPDGITYARRTGAAATSGEDIRDSPLFAHVRHHDDSFYRAPDPIRQIPAWFSYRRLENYPIIATVGSAEADILAEVMDRQWRYIIPRTIISVLVLLFSVFMTRFLLHRRKEAEKYQRLLTEQMIAVQEKEREWIGRELHDNVSQVLTTVKLYLESASGKDCHPLVPKSMDLVNGCIREIRDLSHQLSSPTLGTRSLIDSMNGLAESLRISGNLKIEFEHSGSEDDMGMSLKLALYRIVQEQLNNILKHAEAKNVGIRLSFCPGEILLVVSDDGKGFNRQSKTNGKGINNIISRAGVFGGRVHIESAPGLGCCLTVQIREQFRRGENRRETGKNPLFVAN